ncbi:hypothetical protein COK01_26795 [Priestia megaterium]|uniref:hypothetical protein n=1 Tax=Priestia megaterium TaxID=1404 RepID=UPI000BF9274D|nr:hypothetical protein [Priestia megaterium]PFP44696.1 hypothetical protein COK01_26795 [Priestia megaterium]
MNLKPIIKLISVLVISSILVWLIIDQNVYNVVSSSIKESIGYKDEITLKQAYEVGFHKAYEKDKNAALIYIGSVEDGKKTGFNGKKGDWQMIMAMPTKQKRLLVVIEKGKLISTKTLDDLDDSYLRASHIRVDSDAVVRKAIKKFSLEPGETNFSKGYHFRFLIDDNKYFISVIGKRGKKEMEIFYNAQNGKYLGRSEGNIK